MSAIIIAIDSDIHCGSSVALCPPEIPLDDGGSYKASPAQSELWRLYNERWDWQARLRDEHKAELYCEWNGDLVDGNHHGTTQILSGNPTVQGKVVDACLHVPLQLAPEKMFFVRGTGTHTGPSSSSEERIALGLYKDGRPVQMDPDTGNASWWHLKMEIMGVRLDFAHHGRAGQRPWTEQNAVVLLAKEIFHRHSEEDAFEGRSEPTFPHVVVRSHFHRHWDSGPDACPTRVLSTPAYQLATEYIHKKHTETIADIGGICILIRDGDVEVFKKIWRPSRGTTWRP